LFDETEKDNIIEGKEFPLEKAIGKDALLATMK